MLHQDNRTAARRSRLETPHGDVQLPAFMPVGTLGSVKGLTIDMLRNTGSEMVLGNAYHLALRPGADVVKQLGGLHAFSGWDGPMLTDSGGFQIFSLAQQVKISDEQAVFRSHIDGSRIALSPERAISIQQDIGADIAMVLDHVVALPSPLTVVEDAMHRTLRWAQRCREVGDRKDQAMFGIVQGGLDKGLRRQCAISLAEMDFDGYAVGGLSVGESPEQMAQALEHTVPFLPADRPRYLMGVGRPEDLLNAISRGIDLFDCVMPTRNGRNGLAFTDQGTLRLRNLCRQVDDRPVEEHCGCLACRHSRGYLRHLFLSGEMLGPILLSVHNLTYYQRLMVAARESIEEDRFDEFQRRQLERWAST
ncbi:MAG: tRNA guanosine(34) transglycosylase Tgt [Planctomycetales bacterium]